MTNAHSDTPGSGLDKAPSKSLAEKLHDTVKTIIKRGPKGPAQKTPV
jgi:hypothetical protein